MANHERIRFPIERVHLEITNACNFDCTFCPDGIMSRPRGVMKPTAFAQLAPQLADGPLVRRVMLHLMGEPLLHPAFFELVRIGVEHGLFLHLTTNGSRLRPDMVDRLLTCGLGEITVSLQTPDAGSFEEARGTRMPWSDYADGVTRLAARAIQLPESTPVTVDLLLTGYRRLLLPSRAGIQWLDATAALRRVLGDWTHRIHAAASNGAPAFDLPAALDRCRAAAMHRWNVLPIHPRVQFETRQLGDWANAFADTETVRPARFGTCNTLRDQFGILWNGDVVLCCADFDGRTVVGNALTRPLRSLLLGEECRMIRAGFDRFRVVHPHCRRCLGGVNEPSRVLHEVGSVLYHHVYTRWFRDRRVTPNGAPVDRHE